MYRIATSCPDMSDVRGNAQAVIAATRAVSSRKNLLITARSGTGAMMLARRLPGLMAALSDKAREVLTDRYRKLRFLSDEEVFPAGPPPLRAPHYSISEAALVGTRSRPGELGLGAFGLLYLDEVAEFRFTALHSLARAISAMGPESPLIVAGTWPCPCGMRGNPTRACTCSEQSLKHYKEHEDKVASLLNLEIRTEMLSLSLAELRDAPPGTSSAELRAGVLGMVP